MSKAENGFDQWVDLNDPGLERTNMTHQQVAVVKASFLAGIAHEREECAKALQVLVDGSVGSRVATIHQWGLDLIRARGRA